MYLKRIMLSAVILAGFAVVCFGAEVKNGGFEETYIRDENSPQVQAMRKMGWKFQSPLLWPKDWQGSTGVSNVTFAVVQTRPHSGKNCILLWGQAGSSGYLSTQVKGLKKEIYKVSFWGRGKGTATSIFAGVHIVLNAQMSDKWEQYQGIYRNSTTPAAKEASLTLQAQKGEVFFDDVSVEQCDVLEAALVEESAKMRKEGRWLAPDAKPGIKQFRDNVLKVKRLLPKLKTYAQADPIPETLEMLRLLEARVEELRKVTGQPTVEQANFAAAYSEIAERLLVELEFEDVEE